MPLATRIALIADKIGLTDPETAMGAVMQIYHAYVLAL